MSINEKSKFKVSKEVEISNISELETIQANLIKMQQLLTDAQILANTGKSYSVEWVGEAKLAYDSFVDFLDWYNRDLLIAIEGYTEFIRVVNQELNQLAKGESNVLQEFGNVTRI